MSVLSFNGTLRQVAASCKSQVTPKLNTGKLVLALHDVKTSRDSADPGAVGGAGSRDVPEG
jgi:hypothetical protein